MDDSGDRSLPARRAADTDREIAAQKLRDATGEGLLDFAELETRLSAVYSAKTLVELEAITADLPALSVPEIGPLNLQTKNGAIKKRGYWRVPTHITAECTSGSIKLDFTESECPHREVTVEVSAKSGSVVLIVPKGWSVDLDRATVKSGSIVNRVRERPSAGAPVLHVSGNVLSGSIRARHPRRSFWVWLLGRFARLS